MAFHQIFLILLDQDINNPYTHDRIIVDFMNPI
jgi:hypothetical protein